MRTARKFHIASWAMIKIVADLEDCQEGSEDISYCQVGRDEHLRLSESLMDSEESSIQHWVLMKMGSVDLIICQEGSGSIPYCQMGRDELISRIQPEELTEKESSESDQQVQLTAEDMRSRMMIGGIQVFLPFSQEEAEIVLQMQTTAEEQSQLTMTVKRKLEQTFETTQAMKGRMSVLRNNSMISASELRAL
jgi:hypothetical protein